MGKKNIIHENISIIYKLGIITILLLVLLNIPPTFSPPAFGKAIPFRIIFSLILLFFTYDLFFKKSSAVFKRVIEKVRAKKDFSFFTPLLLFLFLLISVFFSIDRNFSIFGGPSRGGGFLNFGLLIIFSYFLFFILTKEEWKTIWKTVFFTGVVATFFAVLQWQEFFGDVIVGQTSRPYASFGNPTILGVYLSILVFPITMFLLKEESKKKKFIYLFILFLVIFGTLLTYTRAAILGIIFGAIYFGLFFPFKERVFRTIKLVFVFLVTLALFIVYYVNMLALPSFVEENKFLYGLTQRMDIVRAFEDPRIGGFVIGWNSMFERPFTGYGVENFSYAFDRYYDPYAPFIYKDIPWWDKAHNLPIEIGTWGGFPALFALLLIFITLFLSLRKRKSLESHSMEATLICFFVANFFTVDDFSTYLLFMIIIGYIFSLTVKENEINLQKEFQKREKILKYKYPFLIISIPLVFIFINNYNYNLLISSKNINIAEAYERAGLCEVALSFAKKATQEESPISSYLLSKRALIAENCLEGEERGKELFLLTKEASEKRPSYTRTWTNLANASIGYIPYAEEKEEVLNTAKNASLRALEISPLRFPIKSDLAQIYLMKGDWEKALQVAKECLVIAEHQHCYFAEGVALAGLGKPHNNPFEKLREDFNVVATVNGIINIQIHTENYEAMVPLYLLLIEKEPENAQNYSSLATVYKEIGDYENAKKYALKALEVQPEAAHIVNFFIDSLPK
jgi:tetratricopeptide (TPR) repeat protein